MPHLTSTELKRYAALGIQAEIERLQGLLPTAGRAPSPSAPARTKQQRPKLTAAARKLISRRMKEYWAKRKKAEAKG